MQRIKTKNRVLVLVAVFLFVCSGIGIHNLPAAKADTIPTVAFANISLANGQVGNAYSTIIPITYEYGTSLFLQLDNVPPGLSASLGSAVSANSGSGIGNNITISGTPTESGIYRMTANLSDSAGSVVGMQQYNLTITTASGNQTPSLSLSNNPQLLASGLGTANPTFSVSAGQQSATLWAGDLTASPAQDLTVSGMDLFSTTDLSQYFTNFRIMDGATVLGSSPNTLTFQFSKNTVITKGTTHTLTMIADVLATAQMPTTLSGLNVTLYATHVVTTVQNVAENGFAQGSVLIIAAVASPSPFSGPTTPVTPVVPVTPVTPISTPPTNTTSGCNVSNVTTPPLPAAQTSYAVNTNAQLQVRMSQETGLAAYGGQSGSLFSNSPELFDLYVTNTSLTAPLYVDSISVNDDGNLSDFSNYSLSGWDSDADLLTSYVPTSFVQNGQIIFTYKTPLVIPPNNMITYTGNGQIAASAAFGSGHRYYLSSPSSIVATSTINGASLTAGGVFPSVSLYPVVILPCYNPNFAPAMLSVSIDPNAPPAYSVIPGTTGTVLASYIVKNSSVGAAELNTISLKDPNYNSDISNLQLYINSQPVAPSLPKEQNINTWQFDCVFNVAAPCPTSVGRDIALPENSQMTLTLVGNISASAIVGTTHAFTIVLTASGAPTDPNSFDQNQPIAGSGTIASNPITIQATSSSPQYPLASNQINIGSAIRIATMSLPAAVINMNYSATVPFTYTGTGTLTATWSGLPSTVYGEGNSLNPDTVIINPGSGKTSLMISGTPRADQVYPVTLTITDGQGNAATATMILTVNIGGSCALYPPTYYKTAIPDATVGKPYTLTIQYNCTPNTNPYNLHFSLPSWLTATPAAVPGYLLNIWGGQAIYGDLPQNGLLTITFSGIPPAAGTVNITSAKNDIYDYESDRNLTYTFQVNN